MRVGYTKNGIMDLFQKLWLFIRKILEKFVSRERLDTWLWKIGFYRLRARLFVSLQTMPDGSHIFIRRDDERIVHEIYEGNEYSRPQIAANNTIIDVGAHVGIFTIYAAKKLGGGRILSIEPDPSNLINLHKNIAQNCLSNVEIYPCAVSDHEGLEKLYFLGDQAMNSFVPPKNKSFSVSVRVRTLDEIAQTANVEACHLLKIDVERHELSVLRGAAQLLSITRQVIIEVSKDIATIPEMGAYFSSLGFKNEIVRESRESDSDPGGFVIYAYR